MVLKMFSLPRITRSVVEVFVSEASTLWELRHQNVVDFLGCCVDPPNLGIVMKYCANGNLYENLRDGNLDFSKSSPMKIAKEIACGMEVIEKSASTNNSKL